MEVRGFVCQFSDVRRARSSRLLASGFQDEVEGHLLEPLSWKCFRELNTCQGFLLFGIALSFGVGNHTWSAGGFGALPRWPTLRISVSRSPWKVCLLDCTFQFCSYGLGSKPRLQRRMQAR